VTSDARDAMAPGAQDQVRSALNKANDTDIRVVVTKPGVTASQLGRMLRSVEERVGKGDTYLGVTTDGKMAGISKKFSSKEMNQLISQTSGDLPSRLSQFADLADQKAADKGKSSAITGFVVLAVLILVAFGIVALIRGGR
jgi:type II secretory pathway component PulF